MRALACAGALTLFFAAGARAQPALVNIQFAAFAPGQIGILPGESVDWQNAGGRTHTVTADDGAFDSGLLLAGDHFDKTFPAAGVFAYHCSLHPTMTGEIDVSPVLLDPLPVQAVPVGNLVEFSGRTATPDQPVEVQRISAAGTERVATAVPAADGSWSVRVPARLSGDYRATSPAGASPARRLLVSNRKVVVRATARGLRVSVTPPLPYGRVVLELALRERFGWWPSARGRLDYTSRAVFAVARRPVRARVELVAADGWTPLAVSAPLRLARTNVAVHKASRFR